MSSIDWGVITDSTGFMVEGAGVLKSEYISAAGVDIKDSAGEFSNLTCGVEAGVLSAQEAIFSSVTLSSLGGLVL
jgi:hypothetical protein